MAMISVGGARAGRRSVDYDLPLVPFIDFMICLIAFLMVTAVWTRMSRINADARLGGADASADHPPKELHLSMDANGFELTWRQSGTVLESERVPAASILVGGERRYPALSDAITRTWQAHGQHRAESDRELDHAVLHVKNDIAFDEVVAALDALNAPRRGAARSAFSVAFAAH